MMKIYEFGDRNKPIILLLSGTSGHWKGTYGKVIPLLGINFFVACVSYDGFDENEDTIFLSMIDEVEKIENYIQKHYAGNVYCAYGCSLGGSFVGLLMQRKNVHIDNAILGSSDLDQSSSTKAEHSAKVTTYLLYSLTQGDAFSACIKFFMALTLGKTYVQNMMHCFDGLSYVKKESIYNQMYSDLITPLEKHIEIYNTNIYCFYAKKMGKQYLKRYHEYFKNPRIVSFDLQHEELLACYPEKWTKEIEKCCF